MVSLRDFCVCYSPEGPLIQGFDLSIVAGGILSRALGPCDDAYVPWKIGAWVGDN